MPHGERRAPAVPGAPFGLTPRAPGRPPAKGEFGGVATALRRLLIVAIVLGLGGTVLFLSAQLHHRQYRIGVVEGQLVVERGLLLPFGYAAFVPEEPASAAAYAPFALPAGATIDALQIFEERAELDRTLFALLARWANTALASEDPAKATLAMQYVGRAELLPGISETQRGELRKLRNVIAYHNSRRLLAEGLRVVATMRDEIRMARDAGDLLAPEAQRELDVLEAYAGKCSVIGETASTDANGSADALDQGSTAVAAAAAAAADGGAASAEPGGRGASAAVGVGGPTLVTSTVPVVAPATAGMPEAVAGSSPVRPAIPTLRPRASALPSVSPERTPSMRPPETLQGPALGPTARPESTSGSTSNAASGGARQPGEP